MHVNKMGIIIIINDNKFNLIYIRFVTIISFNVFRMIAKSKLNILSSRIYPCIFFLTFPSSL
ncbi:hypothetical protein DRQ09_07570 [candidate division KSB1 bacterium]|nr:MAG: hypothetical protein DRQ09_07570 [candidate division KSB1 bacterium]